MRWLRGLAALAVVSLCSSGLAVDPAQAATKALSDSDAAAYSAAFQAAAQGDYDAAEHAAQAADDKSLLGYISLQKLMGPQVTATYADLTAWLKHYADLPGADRVFALARKRQPRGAADPKIPAIFAATGDVAFTTPTNGAGQQAREAFYSGDVEKAHRLAVASGERWIAGLSAFRLKNYAEAMSRFQQVALDNNENEWLRAGAAYWAARAAIASGQPELAPDYLRIASRSPATFYGMIAERQLGLEPGADPDAYVLAKAGFGPAPPSNDGEFVKTAYAALNSSELSRLMKSDARAKRAVALAQIGRRTEAGLELRAGLAAARTDSEKRTWTTLALELNGGQSSRARQMHFDPDDYPTPQYAPVGGFTVDKALVFAVVRQESRFDAYATSHAGAIGLMQLMPQTAAAAVGDDKLLADSTPLYDPAVNLRAGQDYIESLMGHGAHGDMLRTVAAYNGGPGTLMHTQAIVGDSDVLMLIECMPAAETRGYVEKVMSNYWIYRRIFGEGVKTMDAVASGAGSIDPRLDR